MAILEKEIKITLNQANTSYFEEKGYIIPRHNDKYGTPRVKRGTKIMVKVNDLFKNSRYEVTKICDDCGKEIPNQPYGRVIRGRGNVDGKDRCGSCVQKYMKRTYENSLENWAKENNKKYLIKEYSSKNELNPSEIPHALNEYFIWKCSKCESEYESKLSNRTVGECDCPYCAGQKVNHTNCLWTTRPDVACILFNPDDGYNYTSGSGKHLKFICPNCKDVTRKNVRNVVRKGLGCTKCSDGLSFNEKFMVNLLTQLKENFKTQKSFKWSLNKRYDFYLPKLNMIIEMHGNQHYVESFSVIGGRTLKEEQENDKLKEGLARENGIKHYIIIDCRKAELEYVKNNIINSELSRLLILNDIDWKECNKYACNSLVKLACDLWNKGHKNTVEISNLIGLGVSTIGRYLKKGNQSGWCDYEPRHDHTKIAIVQLTLNGEFIREWESASLAERELNISNANISSVCKRKTKTCLGYIWMYKSDYKDNKFNKENYRRRNLMKIVQLSNSAKFIKKWDSILEASESLKINRSSISAVCNGKAKTAGGYMWFYKNDYEKNFKHIKPVLDTRRKEIVQLTTNGEFINMFNSVKEASESIQTTPSNISAALKGISRTAKGFVWIYKDDYYSINKEKELVTKE